MTQKEQLDAALTEVSDLKTKLATAEDSAKQHKTAAEDAAGKVTKAEQATKDVQAKLDTEVSAHGATKTSLQAAEEKVKTLEAGQKTTQTKAEEILASKGVAKATEKAAPGEETAANDGAALFEEYNSLMKAGSSREASEFWAKNEKALMAFANAPAK